MEYIVNVENMRLNEGYTINEVGIGSLVLMEKAAESVCAEITEHFDKDKSVIVYCGTGNNGGDGLAIARILYLKGYNVNIYLIGNDNKRTSENETQLDICSQLNMCFIEDYKAFKYDIVVDAIFGIGLTREIRDDYYQLIDYINSNYDNSYIYSIDIPSGLDADNGVPLGISVKAHETITFQWLKQGLLLNQGPIYSGIVKVKEVNILLKEANVFTYDEADLSRLPERIVTGNKGTFGKVLCIAGSDNMPGAALLCSKAALKAGTGMLRVLTAANNLQYFIHELPEAMFDTYEHLFENSVTDTKGTILDSYISWCDTVCIGPGITTDSEYANNLLEYILLKCSKPVIVDADGINILSKNMELLNRRKEMGYVTVLTPHPGEFKRLFETEIKECQFSSFVKANQNLDFIKKLSEKYSIILCAKDARTVVTDGFKTYINKCSSESLATAGSGDVYTGILAAVLASFMAASSDSGTAILPVSGAALKPENILTGCCLATLIHGIAGMQSGQVNGSRGTIASDIINILSNII